MSGHDHVGDLIPQDMAKVFAHERLTKGGRRKKQAGSLGRAFSWLKGKKKKGVYANGHNLDLGGVKGGKQTPPLGPLLAVPKPENDVTLAPPHVQENVFIEGSRPKYLEDLHTEAQEGLKLLRQEETNSGEDYRDDQSVISTVTQQTEEDGRFSQRRTSLESDSTFPDTASTVSARSSVSSRSTRSGLTRQASTFRPLNSGNKPEKAKARRRHRRTTVVGIPQHIQRELGLDRAAWAAHQAEYNEQLPNGESLDIPTIDGPQPPGAHDQVQGRPSRARHTDDMALLHQHMGPQLSAFKKPQSLAVPWMTTGSHLHPPSPVMSMSPQATYLSKIIPNAVLPPSVDVVELSRSRSRSSVRTVSKSSVLLASPASSRASSARSSTKSSTLSSASRYPYLSDSSGWSRSDSSETLVSDSSTISSSGTPRQGGSQVGDVEEDGEGKESSKKAVIPGQVGVVHSSVSMASSRNSRTTAATNGKARVREDEAKQEGAFIRSLSVMKPKRPPAPPSRSYSLHKEKLKRRSRDLAEVRLGLEESPPQSGPAQDGETKAVSAGEIESSPMSSGNKDSPGYTADTSSLDDSAGSVMASPLKAQPQEPGSAESSPQKQESTPQENGLKGTVSPSSGYSSQNATPTLPSKQTHKSSPRNKRGGILAKLQSIFPGASPVTPAPTAVIQPEVSEITNPLEPQPSPPVDTVTPSPSVMALRQLFDIPPPPNISAPPPPPPEVWVHNKRTFELLLGPPAPNDTYAAVRKNPKDRRYQKQSSPSVSREGSVKNLERRDEEQVPVQAAGGVLERVSEPTATTALMFESGKGQVSREDKETGRLGPVVQKEEDKRLAQVEQNSKVGQKDEPEKVRGSTLVDELRKVQERQLVNGMSVKVSAKTKIQTQSPATEVKTDSQPKMNMFSVVTAAHVSPSPSPPPAHNPPLPPAKKTPLVTPPNPAAAPKPPIDSPTGESSWPLPPPPLEQPTISGLDHVDMPLPPPPPFSPGGSLAVVTTEPVKASPVEKEQTSPPKTLSKPTFTKPAHSIPVVKPTEDSETKSQAKIVSAPQPAPSAPQQVSTLPQGIPPPPQVKPPPPPQVAPTPPVQEVSSPSPPEIPFPPTPAPQGIPTPHQNIPPPPQSIPPPPPAEVPPPPPPEVPHPPEEIPSPYALPAPPLETTTPAPTPPQSIPPPPQSIPPPPPAQVPPPPPPEVPHSPEEIPSPYALPAPHLETTTPALVLEPALAPEPALALAPAPSTPVNIPPPTLVQVPASLSQEPTPVTTEEASPVVIPSLSDQAPDQAEVTLRVKQPSNEPSQEAPQKPIRRSLIMTSPLPNVTTPTAPTISPSPTDPTLSPPPTTATTISPPTTATTISPPPTAITISPPPTDTTISPPPTTATTISPPPTATTISPSPTATTISPPPTTAITISPPPTDTTISPPPTATTISPPTTATTISPSPTDTTISPSPTDTTISPPPTDTTISPPPIATTISPPPTATTISPSPTDTTISPPPTATTISPPTTATTISPPPTDTTISPPPTDTTISPPPTATTIPPPPTAITISPSPTDTTISPSPTDTTISPPPTATTISSPPTAITISPPTTATTISPPTTDTTISPSPTAITISPPPTAITISPPPVDKSRPSVLHMPPSSITATSPTTKSPPATVTSPSMRMQEAIRLRTAARTSGAPSRLSLHPPTSPAGGDLHKSPSATASFIFSKSTKKVVIETPSSLEAQANVQKNVVAELSSVSNPAKMTTDTEKKAGKVPPPVARKPKPKVKETENSEETEHVQTAGQQAQPDDAESPTTTAPNGTAVSVEDPPVAST